MVSPIINVTEGPLLSLTVTTGRSETLEKRKNTMGEAKRRQKEIAQLKEREKVWRESLSEEEQIILLLAERLDQRLVGERRFSEGCYHLAFFMTQYLANKGIIVTPVVGWINDGTWKGVTSHAWIEYLDKKTDSSLTYTTHPKDQPTGALLVQDYVLRKGKASYTYYKNDDPIVAESIEWMRSVPELESVFSHKVDEHKIMLNIASSNDARKYLENAPQVENTKILLV